MSVYFRVSENQSADESIKEIIINIVKEQKPETASQLIRFVQETTNLAEKEIVKFLNQLEEEDKIYFNTTREPESVSIVTYLFTFESVWYWTIVAVAIATVITVFIIPQELYPLVYVRNVLGVIFVLFLPGYSFVKAFFPVKVPIKTSSKSLDTIERVVLSIGLSIALTPMVGLILYYTPIGIGLTPITLSLLALTTAFSTAALVREYQAKSVPFNKLIVMA